MLDPQTEAARARARQIRRELAVARKVAAAYQAAYDAAADELDNLLGLIEEAPTPATLMQAARLRNLLDSLEQELAGFAATAGGAIDQGGELSAQAGGRDAVAQVDNLTANRVPAIGAVHEIAAGHATAILASMPTQVSGMVRDTLVRGVTVGLNSRVIGRDIQRILGGSLTRALTIARTEMLTAYRDATLSTYRANRNVVREWAWLATQDSRTCPVCWAMHGSVHSLDERLSSHPACRCAMVPLTSTWGDLGLAGSGKSWRPPLGPDLFAQLAAGQQRRILGPGKYREYRAGRLQLPDLVQQTVHPIYGPGLRERRLADAVSVRGQQAA